MNFEAQREERLAQESILNSQLLSVKIEQARLHLDLQRQKQAMELRLLQVSTRKRLRDEGYTEEEVTHAVSI